MEKSFHGKFRSSKGRRLEVISPVVIFEQNGNTIVFSPALEVYGYGQEEIEAKKSFEINLAEFFRYTINKGTFESELKRLGWEVKKRKKKYLQPSFSKLLRRNEKLVEIVDHNSIRTEQKSIMMPAYA